MSSAGQRGSVYSSISSVWLIDPLLDAFIVSLIVSFGMYNLALMSSAVNSCFLVACLACLQLVDLSG